MLDARQIPVDAEWVQLARQFDAQFRKLASLLHNEAGGTEQGDHEVASQVLHRLDESCAAIAGQLDNIEGIQAAMPPARDLLASLKRMAGLERGSPRPSAQGTPSSAGRPAKKPAVTTPVRSTVDFDAFPSTPTLDQLGLSGHAMAVVGDQHMAFDSDTTDCEQPHARGTCLSSSSAAMSTPRTSLQRAHGAPDSDKPSWPALSTPPLARQSDTESSPFPFGSPLVQAAGRSHLL